jgi:hypothetical protein
MRLGGRVARMKDRRCAYRILVDRREGQRLLRRPEHRWETAIK